MTFTEAVGVLISAADVRGGQWQALVDNIDELQPLDAQAFSPTDTIDELWEVWGTMQEDPADTEAGDMAALIKEAIRVVRKIYD